VKIGYNPLEASGKDASREGATRAERVFSFLASDVSGSVRPTPSLFSLFAQKRVFASPSFPCTYSLFQNEYSCKSQQSKSFIHSSAETPGCRRSAPFTQSRERIFGEGSSHLCFVTSSLLGVRAGIAATPVRSCAYALFRAHRGCGGTARAQVYPEFRRASAHTHERAQLQSSHAFTSQFSVDPGVVPSGPNLTLGGAPLTRVTLLAR
jgi:hypothetical protein